MQIKNTLNRIRCWFRQQVDRVRYSRKRWLGIDEKIFIIGRNKTGTTSLEKLFRSLGYVVGPQIVAESMLPDYAKRDFRALLAFCDTAEVFQDAPFSWPETYLHLYQRYPNAKFVLTIRDNSEQWYRSLVQFHKNVVKSDGTPSAEDLANHHYRWKGFLLEVQKIVYGATNQSLYDKNLYIQSYEDHNRAVQLFFSGKKNFLCMNLADANSAEKLSEFLNIDKAKIVIPHVNKTQ